IIILLNHAPLLWFIIATAFDFVLIGFGYLLSYRKKVGNIADWSYDNTVARTLLTESLPLLLSGAAIVIYQKMDQIMIRNMLDYSSLGQFSIASKLTDFVVFIPTVIAQTVTPFLIKIHQND